MIRIQPDFTYRIREVIRVVDGDTYYLNVSLPEPLDLGFYITIDPIWAIEVRLYGWDTPEKTRGNAYERSEAKLAQSQAENFLKFDTGPLWVKTEKSDDFGRWLGDIWIEEHGSNIHLGDYLASVGLASAWPTRWRDMYGKLEEK